MPLLKDFADWRKHSTWIGAAAVPVLIRAVLVAFSSQGRWGALPPYLLARVNADSLILESIAVVIAAPLVGVAVPAAQGMIAAAAFALSAAVVGLWSQPAIHLTALVPPYLTLLLAAAAMCSIGAAAASWLRHPLDASLSALVVCLAVGLGLFLAGPLLDGAPQGLVDAALVASPVVATASAADIDLLRGEPLYRFSPIAHRQFEYPAWTTACATYAAVAVLGFAIVVMSSNRRRMLSAERITV